MTDSAINTQTLEHPKKNYLSSLINIIILIVAIYYIAKFPTILLVIIGFGAVVMIHEFGHFISAKLVGIKVDEFAIGMGAVVTGLKRTKKGLRLRLLPSIISDAKSNAKLVFDLPILAGKEGETEYQLRLLPLGGFVKMLGQDDLGPDQQSDDPRSFGNKAIWQRAIVVSAGVIMNLISGILAFVFVFSGVSGGVKLPPAVIGGVMAGSPSDKAGLVAGDKVLSINGETSIMTSFMDVKVSSVFAGNNDVVFEVEKKDGTTKLARMKPEMDPDSGMKMLGIIQPVTLTIAQINETPDELTKLNLAPGDTIVETNGQPISLYGELLEQFRQSEFGKAPVPQNLKIQKKDGGFIQTVLYPTFTAYDIYGMTPQVKVSTILKDSPAEIAGVQVGDILISAGDQSWPTMKELPDICNANSGKEVPFTVLRKDQDGTLQQVQLKIIPKRDFSILNILKMEASPARIGIAMELDIDNTIVANAGKWLKDQDKAPENMSLENLPRGSKIVSIDGKDVSDWQDILLAMQLCAGKECPIEYVAPGTEAQQTIVVNIPTEDNKKWFAAGWTPDFGKLSGLPLENLEVLYKADNISDSFKMGMIATKGFLAQTYMTISGMLSGSVNMKAASGPIGIMKLSYTVASTRPITYYIYLMAMLSVCIAVFNFLPLPILDGGLMVLLLLEKIMKRPLSMKTQEVINWVGLALILLLFISVTRNDLISVLGGS